MNTQIFFLLALASASFSLPSKVQFTTVNEKYHVSKVELDFMQAYALCKINGWSLATEMDAEDTAKLNEALTSLDDLLYYQWLGGFYQNGGWEYPQWIWLDSGVTIDYTNWNNVSTPTSPPDYPCFAKKPTLHSGGEWEVLDCNLVHNFICVSNAEEN